MCVLGEVDYTFLFEIWVICYLTWRVKSSFSFWNFSHTAIFSPLLFFICKVCRYRNIVGHWCWFVMLFIVTSFAISHIPYPKSSIQLQCPLLFFCSHKVSLDLGLVQYQYSPLLLIYERIKGQTVCDQCAMCAHCAYFSFPIFTITVHLLIAALSSQSVSLPIEFDGYTNRQDSCNSLTLPSIAFGFSNSVLWTWPMRSPIECTWSAHFLQRSLAISHLIL